MAESSLNGAELNGKSPAVESPVAPLFLQRYRAAAREQAETKIKTGPENGD
jgi:hypothetical protein